ncbi:hypothetical protein [uncultured Methylobacterium sp.]|uniref:hypothetical protein n=1 Tax=uncultured Methylobacterium sp. TaxID=157278 RepID=UPI0035C9F151
MPTIRRPSWRPRTIHGYKVEARMTTSNLELECDPQWQRADWTDQARALLIQRPMTAWFVRLPKRDTHFATLIEFSGMRSPANRPWHDATYDGAFPITTWDNPMMSNHWDYHYSIVNGHIAGYLNGNPKYLWGDVAEYLKVTLIADEDKDALRAMGGL